MNQKTQNNNLTLTRLICYTIFGAAFIFLVYYMLGKGDDVKFSQNLHQLFIDNAGYKISKYIGHIFSSKVWIAFMIIAWIVGIFGFKNNKKVRKNIFWFGLSVLIATIAVSVLKVVIGRYRPFAYFNDPTLSGFKHFCLKNDACHSSPSAHTSLSFASLFCVTKIFDKWWVGIICALLAAVIALSRVIVWRHYLSDIIFGFYIGMISVYWAQWILKVSTSTENNKIKENQKN